MNPISRPALSYPQVILFDLDGTLVDSAPDLGAAGNAVRTSCGLSALPLAQFRAMAGAGGRGMLQVGMNLRPEDAEYAQMSERFLTAFEARNNRDTRYFAGIEALLAAIVQRGLAWGVVTNKHTRFASVLRAQQSLLQSAAAWVCGDTTAHAKPHPAPLLEAARQVAVAPQRCWYVGDDARDMQAARAAGMVGIAAAYGYLGEHALESWDAQAAIHSAPELLALLDAAIPTQP